MGFNTAFIKEAQTDLFLQKTKGPKTENGVKPYTKPTISIISVSFVETLKFDYTPTPTKTLHTKPLTQKERESRETETETEGESDWSGETETEH